MQLKPLKLPILCSDGKTASWFFFFSNARWNIELKGLNKEQVEDNHAKIKHMSSLDFFFLLGALILLHMKK